MICTWDEAVRSLVMTAALFCMVVGVLVFALTSVSPKACPCECPKKPATEIRKVT